ncbi:hypothetical protein ACS0TY_010465 [Phlomoides rotata]
MDTSQWQQGIGVVRAADQNPIRPSPDKKPRPEQGVNCPRCNSTNTKFCYYNNYSLSQPRYFCKTCRRYWTEGGTLRNVPVGGGSRRKHRPSSSSKKSAIIDLTPPDQNPKFLTYDPPIYNGLPEIAPLPFAQNPNFSSTDSPHLSFMDLLKTTSNFTSPIPAPNSSLFDSNSSVVFSSVHDIKPSTSLSFDQFNGSTMVQDHATGFPFEEPKPVSSTGFGLQLDSNGYWNGVLPGGSW